MPRQKLKSPDGREDALPGCLTAKERFLGRRWEPNKIGVAELKLNGFEFVLYPWGPRKNRVWCGDVWHVQSRKYADLKKEEKVKQVRKAKELLYERMQGIKKRLRQIEKQSMTNKPRYDRERKPPLTSHSI